MELSTVSFRKNGVLFSHQGYFYLMKKLSLKYVILQTYTFIDIPLFLDVFLKENFVFNFRFLYSYPTKNGYFGYCSAWD